MSLEDTAQDIELMEWERNNLGRGDKPTRFAPGDAGYGPELCVECEDEMPGERRAWGFQICVHCKAEAEQRAGARR